MNHPAHVDLVRSLLTRLDGSAQHDACVGEIPVERYLSVDRFERERSMLWARLPTAVAHESELEGPGACVTADVAGISIIVARGSDGDLRAFRNACRHRGMRLVEGEGPCRKSAFACPYHAWTYDLTGKLVHVPHEKAFHGRDRIRAQLSPAHVEARHGMVWLSLEPSDIGEYLGPIDGELASMRSRYAVMHSRSTREIHGNWKLIVEGFLESYHVKVLHRNSVYPFFIDALAEIQRVGDHVRAGVARRSLAEARDAALESADLRALVNMVYFVFPGTFFLFSPEYVQIARITPLGVDRTRFDHTMLLERTPKTEAEDLHFKRSFALVDDGVFSREDFRVVEGTQGGLRSRANETFLFGELDCAPLWFHESVERHLALT